METEAISSVSYRRLGQSRSLANSDAASRLHLGLQTLVNEGQQAAAVAAFQRANVRLKEPLISQLQQASPKRSGGSDTNR